MFYNIKKNFSKYLVYKKFDVSLWCERKGKSSRKFNNIYHFINF